MHLRKRQQTLSDKKSPFKQETVTNYEEHFQSRAQSNPDFMKRNMNVDIYQRRESNRKNRPFEIKLDLEEPWYNSKLKKGLQSSWRLHESLKSIIGFGTSHDSRSCDSLTALEYQMNLRYHISCSNSRADPTARNRIIDTNHFQCPTVTVLRTQYCKQLKVVLEASQLQILCCLQVHQEMQTLCPSHSIPFSPLSPSARLAVLLASCYLLFSPLFVTGSFTTRFY